MTDYEHYAIDTEAGMQLLLADQTGFELFYIEAEPDSDIQPGHVDFTLYLVTGWGRDRKATEARIYATGRYMMDHKCYISFVTDKEVDETPMMSLDGLTGFKLHVFAMKGLLDWMTAFMHKAYGSQAAQQQDQLIDAPDQRIIVPPNTKTRN